MKQTITEIFIEVEEIISVKRTTGKKSSAGDEENLNSIIEICPHCHQAIFELPTIETEMIENNLKLTGEI